jgi:hypothetical protein
MKGEKRSAVLKIDCTLVTYTGEHITRDIGARRAEKGEGRWGDAGREGGRGTGMRGTLCLGISEQG